MRKINIRLSMVSLIAILIMTLICSACTTSPASVEVTVIKVFTGQPLSGIFANSCVPQFNGFVDYFKSIEDAGGLVVNGKKYKIDVGYLDTKMDISTAVGTYKRAAEDGSVIYYASTSAEFAALVPASLLVKTPIIGSTGTEEQIKNNDMVYAYCADIPYQLVNPETIKWYKDNMWKGTGKMKMARLYVDLAMGKTMDTPEMNYVIENLIGVEQLPVHWFPATITDFTPYVLSIRDEKPDMVFCQMVGDPFALCLKDAVRLGMDITKPQFVGCDWAGVTSTFVQAAGQAGEGSMSGYYYKNLWDTLDNSKYPEVQKMLNIAEKYQNTRRPPEIYAKGLCTAVITQEVITRALQKSGVATKETIQTALGTLDKFNMPLQPPVTFTNCQRLGVNTSGVLTVKGGKLVPLTDINLTPVSGTNEKIPWVYKGGCK